MIQQQWNAESDLYLWFDCRAKCKQHSLIRLRWSIPEQTVHPHTHIYWSSCVCDLRTVFIHFFYFKHFTRRKKHLCWAEDSLFFKIHFFPCVEPIYFLFKDDFFLRFFWKQISSAPHTIFEYFSWFWTIKKNSTEIIIFFDRWKKRKDYPDNIFS